MYAKLSHGIFILLIAFVSTAQAQHLHRKGSLGIDYVEAPDSLLNVLKIEEAHCIWVKSVHPESTAAQLGIRPDDILVSINETDSLYLFDFHNLEQQLKENDPISITYLRKNRKTRAVGIVKPAPPRKLSG